MDDRAHNQGYPEVVIPDYGSPGEIGLTIDEELKAIYREIVNPTVRPKAQILIHCAGGVAQSDVWTTTVRYFIEAISFVNIPNSNLNLQLGPNKVIEGISVTTGNIIPCALIVDAGVDISFTTVAFPAGTIYNSSTHIILIGEIIN